MPLTLYSNYINSAGERVRIAMALKNIDYDYVSVGQIGRAAYREINPQGLMPALDINGQIIQQATAKKIRVSMTFDIFCNSSVR